MSEGHLTDQWHKCYGEAWGKEIVPDSVAHPAKYSRALIRRIYQHCREEGWLPVGSTVVDPFGGVALGAIEAMRLGCHWIGCELEPRFVALGQQNIDLWNSRYSVMPKWGYARIIQGDSRFMASAIGEAELCCSSPPYGDKTVHGGHGLTAGGFADPKRHGKTSQCFGEREMKEYGPHPSQLGNMPATDSGFDAAISSPPFSAASEQPCQSQSRAKKDYRAFTRGSGTKLDDQMRSKGQLARMPHGDLDACVSSPPFESCLNNAKMQVPHDTSGNYTTEYGNSPGLTGTMQGDDFWSASRTILEQVYQVLRPGAHGCWVVKGFVRKGQYVDFPAQWRQLCEAVGFVTLHEHHAMLTEDRGTQGNTDGEFRTKTVEWKSFFRHLAEQKGSPKIDHETVYCMVKI